MSIAVGSVTVDSSGNASGSGLALVYYNALVSAFLSQLPNTATASAIVAWKQGQAQMANAFAVLASYLTTNVVIGPGTFKDSVNNNVTVGFGTFQ